MSLQDRLEAARATRRAEAGLPPETGPARRPKADPVIDLRDKDLIRQISHAPSFSSALAVSGSGDQCPNCGGPTRLDLVDVIGAVDHYACLDCHLMFQAAHTVDTHSTGS
jgi:hypothetical protein